jgi:hypothetical protein
MLAVVLTPLVPFPVFSMPHPRARVFVFALPTVEAITKKKRKKTLRLLLVQLNCLSCLIFPDRLIAGWVHQ